MRPYCYQRCYHCGAGSLMSLRPLAGLRQRLRAERISGAEEERRRRNGRPMTAAELERVLRRYPGGV